MLESEYHARPELSAHRMMDLLKSPATYKHKLEHPTERTPDMLKGSCLHTLALEPEHYAERVAIMPEGMQRRGKDWIEWRDANATLDILTYNEGLDVTEWRDALMRDEKIKQAHDDSQHEISLFWTADNGVKMKARLDMLRVWKSDGLAIIDDDKTCSDASPEEMQREIYNRNYDLQGYVYCEAVRKTYGIEDVRFAICCVEKAEPFLTARYELDDLQMALGKQKYDKAMEAYQKAISSNIWSGYPSGTISPAAWMLKQWGL